MKNRMCFRKIAFMLTISLLGAGLFYHPAGATDDMEGLAKKGDIIPAFSVPAPKSKAHRKYLGIGKEDQFSPAELKAKVVIIEVLNLY